MRSAVRVALVVGLAALAAAVLGGCAGGGAAAPAAPVPARAEAPVPVPAGGAMPRVGHVTVVVLENREYDQVIGGDGRSGALDPFARRGALLTDYRAVAHPSLPNYIAMVSGTTGGIVSDCTDCVVDAPSLADTLEASGRTWRAYAEGLPRPGFDGPFAGRYAKKHVPFLYFAGVRKSPRRMRQVVPYGQLRRDLAGGRLPDFSLVVPDLCHDLHDCDDATGARWLRGFLAGLRGTPALADGVVFVVFDEGTSDLGGGGHVAAFALGSAVRTGARSATPVTHHGLLRTIEDAWGLPRLGRSAAATPITGVWRARG